LKTLVLYGDHRDLVTSVSQIRQELELPDREWRKIFAFHHPRDARASVGGKLLLVRGLAIIGYQFTPKQLRYNSFDKPYFPGGPYFSISHSGDYVSCTISTDNEVGVDLEKIMAIDINEFANIFSVHEWNALQSSRNVLTTFYSFWTRKEAVVKLTGKGLNTPLRDIDVLNDIVMVEGNKVYLDSIEEIPNYSFTIATNRTHGEVSVKRCAFCQEHGYVTMR
jgi:4'-phosphopantetheinyl transferase